MRVRLYLRELYDQPKLALSFNTQIIKVEAVEALLYGLEYVDPSPEALLQTSHRTPPGLASHQRGTAQETRPLNDLVQPCPCDNRA